MYKLNPLFKPIEDTPMPSCVYRMPTISGHVPKQNCNSASSGPDAEISELEKRWTAITSRLERLQADITSITSTSRQDAGSQQSEGTEIKQLNPPTIAELSARQDSLIGRISALMSSLSELKSRLALMNDSQSGLNGLESQQRSLLARIKELNEEIKTISAALGSDNNNNNKAHVPSLQQKQETAAQQPQAGQCGSGDFQDVVIRASPSRPPHSLPMILRQLAKFGVAVYARTHVHSTAATDSQMTEALRSFLTSDPKLERSKSRLAMTLIWAKGVSDEPSLMVSPSAQSTAIQGEANIVRYLVRLLPALLNYERDAVGAARVDQLLDLTESTAPLGAQGAKKDRATAFQQLDKILAARKEPNVVDFVLYSALLNSAGAEKEVAGQPNVRAWLDRCCRSSSQSAAPALANDPRTKLESYLKELAVPFNTMEHPAVFTVPELMEHVSTVMPGLHAKNLFVKDKKSGRLYLITARHDAVVQLNTVAKLVGAKELRFADTDTLMASLAVPQGSVTPFALMNDPQRAVTLVLDEQLWTEEGRTVNFHPLTNRATTGVTVAGFKAFLRSTGHEPLLVQL